MLILWFIALCLAYSVYPEIGPVQIRQAAYSTLPAFIHEHHHHHLRCKALSITHVRIRKNMNIYDGSQALLKGPRTVNSINPNDDP